jgi:hypothetical protein
MVPIAFLPLILGVGAMLLVSAAGLWLVGVAVGSVLGTLLHIVAGLAFAVVAWYWVVPALAKRGFNIPKAQTPTFYLSLVICAALLFAALPNNGLFSVVGNVTTPLAEGVGARDLIGYALALGAAFMALGWLGKKVKL